MLYQCFNRCFLYQSKYSTRLSDIETCPQCGEKRFWFLHLSFFGKSDHEVLIDIKTGDVLSPDPCDKTHNKDYNNESNR